MAIHSTARHCMERQNTLRHCTPRRCSALHGATLNNTAEAALTAPTFAWRCLGPCLQGEWRCWPPGPRTSDRASPVPAGRAACQRSTRHPRTAGTCCNLTSAEPRIQGSPSSTPVRQLSICGLLRVCIYRGFVLMFRV